MSARTIRDKNAAKPKKNPPRKFAFQAYPNREDIKKAIVQAAKQRGWGVSQYLIFAGLQMAKETRIA